VGANVAVSICHSEFLAQAWEFLAPSEGATNESNRYDVYTKIQVVATRTQYLRTAVGTRHYIKKLEGKSICAKQGGWTKKGRTVA
jgi:hypothetical protein